MAGILCLYVVGLVAFPYVCDERCRNLPCRPCIPTYGYDQNNPYHVMKTIRISQVLKWVLLLAMVTDCGSFTAGEESSHILVTSCVTDGGMIADGENQEDHDFLTN